MSDKHLAKGDSLPPLAKDTLRIYSMRYCPYALRTRLVLAHKKIPHEVVNINLKDKPDWFLEKAPVGTVPVLEYNGKIIWESAVCDDYLDEVYPDKPLNPKDPYEKARLRVVMERWGKVTSAFYQMMEKPEEREAKREELFKQLQVFENELKDDYFGGKAVGMVDYHLWGYMEKLHGMYVSGVHDALPGFKNKLPRLAAWTERMLQVAAVKATYTEPAINLKFYEGHRVGKPQYDDL